MSPAPLAEIHYKLVWNLTELGRMLGMPRSTIEKYVVDADGSPAPIGKPAERSEVGAAVRPAGADTRLPGPQRPPQVLRRRSPTAYQQAQLTGSAGASDPPPPLRPPPAPPLAEVGRGGGSHGPAEPTTTEKSDRPATTA